MIGRPKTRLGLPISINRKQLSLAAFDHQNHSGVRRLPYESADAALSVASSPPASAAVKGVKKLGVSPGKLVVRKGSSKSLAISDSETLKGKRDRAIIAVLLGCGLRRRELADLSF